MLGNPIGKGTCGLVWMAKVLSGPHKDTFVAIKIINLDDLHERTIDRLRVRMQLTL